MIDATKTIKKVIKAGVAKKYVKELEGLKKRKEYTDHEAIQGINLFDLNAIIGDFISIADGEGDYLECDTMQRDYLMQYIEYRNPELVVQA